MLPPRSRGETNSGALMVRVAAVAGERARHFVDVYLILRRSDGQVLLLVRANTGFQDGRAGLPSGGLEPGESVLDGVIREAKEEIGVVVRREDLRCVHVVHSLHPGEDEGRVGFFFQAERWVGDPVNAEPHKCSRLVWADPAALPDGVIGLVAEAITAAGQGRSFAVTGWW